MQSPAHFACTHNVRTRLGDLDEYLGDRPQEVLTNPSTNLARRSLTLLLLLLCETSKKRRWAYFTAQESARIRKPHGLQRLSDKHCLPLWRWSEVEAHRS